MMKVLLDMDEKQFLESWMANRLPGHLLGTEKDMTMDIMFSKEDIWERAIAYGTLYEEQLRKVDEYGKEEFLEAVIQRINHNFDANDGVDWITVDNTIKDAFDVLCADIEVTAQDDISLDGLRTALQRYDEKGKPAKCGPWTVHEGGYDLLWQLCYEERPVVGCYRNGDFDNLERECGVSDKTFSQICDLIHAAFPECQMSPVDQKRIKGDLEDISLDGLRTAFQRFAGNEEVGLCGPWSVFAIVDDSSDAIWQLNYDHKAVVACFDCDGEISLERISRVPDKTFSEICDLAKSVFPECQMSFNEQQAIQKNNQSLGK